MIKIIMLNEAFIFLKSDLLDVIKRNITVYKTISYLLMFKAQPNTVQALYAQTYITILL